jgi:hypothetical protein
VTEAIEHWRDGKIFRKIRQAISAGDLETPHCTSLNNCPYRDPARRQDLSQFKTLDFNPNQPDIIELDLPNTCCNIGGAIPTPETACIMCPRAQPGFKPDGKRFHEVLKLVKPFIPKAKELWLAGLGESFWKNKYIEVLEELNFFPYRQTCRYMTFSNATLLNHEKRSQFLKLIPLSHLVISLDAGCKKTYQSIRRLDAFDTVVDNIKNYANDPNRNRERQRLCISYNINMLNVGDVENMVRMWKDYPRIDCICFTATCGNGTEKLQQYLVNEDNYQHFVWARNKINATVAELGMTNVSIFTPLESHYELAAKA